MKPIVFFWLPFLLSTTRASWRFAEERNLSQELLRLTDVATMVGDTIVVSHWRISGHKPRGAGGTHDRMSYGIVLRSSDGGRHGLSLTICGTA